jgi:mitochondrial FAD-linked sulfhydryl oxidase
MNPEVWGPPAWILLHTITFNYPENPCAEDKNNIKNFFKYFSYQIPCNKCILHFKKYMKRNPLTNELLSSKDDLIDWLIDAHNNVNKINNKRIYSRDEVIENYESLYNPSLNNLFSYKNILIIIIIILLIIILILYSNIKRLKN